MEQAMREYRVWLETGDLMGCASIYKRRAWWTIELEPFYHDEELKSKGFRSKNAAYDYAKDCAETYRQQAIEWTRQKYEGDDCCNITLDEIVDSFHMQVVDSEENRTLEEWEI